MEQVVSKFYLTDRFCIADQKLYFKSPRGFERFPICHFRIEGVLVDQLGGTCGADGPPSGFVFDPPVDKGTHN